MIRRLGAHVDLPGLIADAHEEGRVVRVIEAAPTKAASLAAFQEVLDFPDWFGRNLDALADSLGDYGRGLTGACELVWDHIERLADHDPQAAAAIVSILTQAHRQQPLLHVTLIDRSQAGA